jgi:hypothetical protein
VKSELVLFNKKYEMVRGENGLVSCLRHGEPWLGEDEIDNLHLALMMEVQELKEAQENQKVGEHGINSYIVAEDPRYPTLVLQGDFGSVGYDLNSSTGELRKVCICAAHSSNECTCGAWDGVED